MVRLAPKETKFFDMFADMSENLTQAARLLLDLLRTQQDIAGKVQRLSDLDQSGSDMGRAVVTRLKQTVITPFDRQDMHRLASSLGSVLQEIQAAADSVLTYKIQRPSAAVDLAQIVLKQCEQLSQAVSHLEKHDDVLDYCVEIGRLHGEAGRAVRQATALLFKEEKDPIALIKVKELYEGLKIASDKARDAAIVLESLVVKSA